MEVCSPCNTSACHDRSGNNGSPSDLYGRTHSGDLSVNDLKACLTDSLNTENLEISNTDVNLPPGMNEIGDVVKEDEFKDSDKVKSSNSTSKKRLGKCATFPPVCEPKSSVDGTMSGGRKLEVSEVNSSAESVSLCYSRTTSLPTPLKLVSAMKGSREKQGISPKKQLSVTWAPDVYDPIPTSVSHVPSNKNHRYHKNGKKYGKNKQKGNGKSSRGNIGNKKQAKKSGTNNKLKNLHDDSGMVRFGEPQVGFNVESSDPFCGSSFLKKSVTKLHFPVAEAT